MELKHVSVLLDESIENLDIKEDGIYVDCTLGGGGHSEEILKRLSSDGMLIGIDQDDFALNYAEERLEKYPAKKVFVKSNFEKLGEVLDDLGVEKVDGVLYDLGVSSFQLDDDERGFSYHHEGPLDMRMDKTRSFDAKELVNTYPKEKLIEVMRKYGEEKYAGRIAQAIINAREESPIETTTQLAEIIKKAYPAKERAKKHPARKAFQAFRIEVNRELNILEPSFDAAIEHLAPGGRLCIITFHSLEDRIVKNYLKTQQNPCICPPDFPVCVCGRKPTVRLVTRKPISPKKDETEENQRARSAKLRVAERI